VLRLRLASAAVLIPIVLAAVWVGEPWLSLLLAVFVFLGLVELIGLLDAAGFQPPLVVDLALGMAIAVAGVLAVNEPGIGGALGDLLRRSEPPGAALLTYAGGVLVLGLIGLVRGEPRAGFLTWATSSFGLAYVALLAPFMALVGHLAPPDGSATSAVGIVGLPSGVAWAALLLLTVWGYDTGAYLTGRWLGRRPLLDTISPSKTVEGLAGGLVLGTIGAGVGAALVGLAPWHPLVLGPLIGLTAQVGDLAESMLKRAAGRKESGMLIPGHGGVLDRIDSFLFAAPVLAGYAILVAGATA
jgi:phosphatidate cytidylyltransferase